MQTINFSSPLVMGILNVTPDSFFDGGNYKTMDAALRQAEKMVTEGAAIIDVGGYSSRPGATHLSEEEELNRVVPVIQAIHTTFPDIALSVDTFRSSVAKAAIDEGVSLINDISGGKQDAELMKVVAEAGVYYVLMHMRGTAQTMQQLTDYDHLVENVMEELQSQVSKFVGDTSKLIIDPGFGFSKTLDQNYELLANMDEFATLGFPIMVGISRKSMIYKKLNIESTEALNGTSVLHTIALQKGANILRVHDVKEAVETITLVQAIYS